MGEGYVCVSGQGRECSKIKKTKGLDHHGDADASGCCCELQAVRLQALRLRLSYIATGDSDLNHVCASYKQDVGSVRHSECTEPGNVRVDWGCSQVLEPPGRRCGVVKASHSIQAQVRGEKSGE